MTSAMWKGSRSYKSYNRLNVADGCREKGNITDNLIAEVLQKFNAQYSKATVRKDYCTISKMMTMKMDPIIVACPLSVNQLGKLVDYCFTMTMYYQV